MMVASQTTDEVLFEEGQSFRQPWLWVLMVGVFLFVAGSFGWSFISEPDKAGGQVIPALFFLLIWGGVGLLLFTLRLTVRVDQRHIHVRFFPLVIKDIPLEEIEKWEPRTYRPILEYGGWGLRYGWKGWAYNVRGKRGVQLVLTNGKKILIGSQKPEELAAAITGGKASRDADSR